MYRFLCSVFLLVMCCSVNAQRKITVLDLDTHLPVKDVSVKVGESDVYKTNYAGTVSILINGDSISFSHLKYEHEHLALKELTDTMYLLPLEHQLDEVVVLGNDRHIKRMMESIRRDAALYAPGGGVVTFDFGRMLDRRYRRDQKHKEQAKAILREWDTAPIYKR